MVSNIITFIIVLVAIAALGYIFLNFFQVGQTDPKQMLKDYNQKFENTKNLRLNYDFKMQAYSTLIPEISMEFYKLNNDMKVLVSAMGTTTASYIKNGMTVTCTESSLGSLYTSNPLKCSVSQSDYQNMFKPKVDESLYNQTPVIYNGTKTIINRVCDDFVLKLNETQLKSVSNPLTGLAISNTTPENASYIGYEICMDREYGYMASLNITVSSYSQLSGKSTETNLMSMTVTDISADVTENDLKIPVTFAISNVNCDENSIKFNLTAFQNIMKPTITVTLSSYDNNVSTSMFKDSLISGETYSINAPTSSKLSGYYTTKVCIGNDCQSDSCYVYKPYTTSFCYSNSDCWHTTYSTGCCLGQCNLTNYTCYSKPESSDFTAYGQKYYCSGNMTCGKGCSCH
jgi:hypothetical protein